MSLGNRIFHHYNRTRLWQELNYEQKRIKNPKPRNLLYVFQRVENNDLNSKEVSCFIPNTAGFSYQGEPLNLTKTK